MKVSKKVVSGPDVLNAVLIFCLTFWVGFSSTRLLLGLNLPVNVIVLAGGTLSLLIVLTVVQHKK
jgi:hypothetical protein